MTLKDFAQILGLSPTTVSRALGGYPEVSEKTRARVAAAAAEYGYSPDSGARRLATGRSMTIGHILPLSAQHEMVNPVFTDFIGGAGEIYTEAGYDMLLRIVKPGQEEAVYRDLKARGTVDGVIVHGPNVADARIGVLRNLGLPFVVHGRSSAETLAYSWVDMANIRAFTRATDFLLDLGHRRIALLNGLERMDFAHRRRLGFEAALGARGLQADLELMSSADMTEGRGHRDAARLLAHKNPPTAFLCSSIFLGLGVRRAIEEAGLKMGRDISLVIHDDDLGFLKNGDQQVPLYTATRSPVREHGRIAARLLLERIADPKAPFKTALLEPELILGLSTAPAPSL